MIPITDQFLYDLYNFIERAGDIAHVVLRRPKLGDTLFTPENPVFKKYRKLKSRKQFNKLIYYLKKNNFIKVKNLQSTAAFLLTKKGIEKAVKASFKLENNRLKKRKDGKWIMIIFDIPQVSRRARDLLREILLGLGYKLFQHSVWITPYDVFEKTEELLRFYDLDRYVRVFLINEL